MKEVVWFFGSSCSGKKTLIEAILKDPKRYIEQFRLANDAVEVCLESLILIAASNLRDRPELLKVLSKRIDALSSTTILVKGQTVDLLLRLPLELQKLKPEISQKIVFVYTDPQEELERWKKHRKWYRPHMNVQSVIAEIKKQLIYLKEEEKEGIPILSVNGNTGARFHSLPYPPNPAVTR